jgi:hypothetical protein
MADDILKSYLVSIGFKVDEQDYKKFKDSQLDTEKRTKDLSKAFSDFAKIGIGSATALGGMVLKVSSSLENLHFQAQKSGTSAQNLKAFGDAAAQIGIQSESAMGMVEKLNNQIRDNPMGEGAFLGFLGVDANQDKVKVLLDLVDSLAKISGPNADTMRATYGSHFGLSGEDVRTLIRGREELHKYYEERKKVYGDIDAQSLSAHKANEEFRDLEARFSALTNTIGTTFLPLAKDVVSVLEVVVQNLIAADHATDGWSSKIIGLGAALTTTVGVLKTFGLLRGAAGLGSVGTAASGLGLGTVGLFAAGGASIVGGAIGIHDAYVGNFNLTQEQKNERQRKRIAAAKAAGIDTSKWEQPPAAGTHFGGYLNYQLHGDSKSDIKGMIDKYAAKYGVDPALLEAQAWQESRLNPNALSLKGAMGVMQLMPLTAKGLGVNPQDTEQNIEGGARMMAGLLKKYGGNTDLALAAYNAGSGAVDRAGGIPNIAETKDYVASINRRMSTEAGGGVRIEQKTEINVNGPANPKATADLVAQKQNEINAGMARNFAGATQ